MIGAMIIQTPVVVIVEEIFLESFCHIYFIHNYVILILIYPTNQLLYTNKFTMYFWLSIVINQKYSCFKDISNSDFVRFFEKFEKKKFQDLKKFPKKISNQIFHFNVGFLLNHCNEKRKFFFLKNVLPLGESHDFFFSL